MAIILPHGVLFRGGAEERIRCKLLDDGHIDKIVSTYQNLRGYPPVFSEGATQLVLNQAERSTANGD